MQLCLEIRKEFIAIDWLTSAQVLQSAFGDLEQELAHDGDKEKYSTTYVRRGVPTTEHKLPLNTGFN